MCRKVYVLRLASILLFVLASCQPTVKVLKPVTYSDFERFVDETNYVTDAEKFGWSIVQTDVYTFEKVKNANWKKPDGKNTVKSGNAPVTQVSYNDAMAYCQWARKRLPTYEEYWHLVKNDTREIVSDHQKPISDVNDVNVVGNVWELTASEHSASVRLAGGSLFCSEETCHGTVSERKLYVDKETANVHIGFAVVN